MNNDVLIATLNRLENKVDGLSTGLATNTAVTHSHTEMLLELKGELKEVKFETKKTNGRVISLEATQAQLAKVSTQNSGIIVDIQDRLQKEVESGQRQDVEINKLIKKDSERAQRVEFSTKTKLMKLDTKEKIKLSFFAMIIGSIGTTLVLLLEWIKQYLK